ncbi:MAG: peroxiredoxin [Actinomycetia bacterium]|nr:peroxiredoxin [Actinomycetes bacterium]
MHDPTQLPDGLPEPDDDGAADHLPGMSLPDLALDTTGGTQIRLDDLGAGPTVLYLYPKTGRPGVAMPPGWDEIPGARGCTTEACDFRDHHRELQNAGVERVYGVSSQPSAYQAEAAQRLKLPFALVADPDLQLAARLSLPTFVADGERLYKRLTLVVRDGSIGRVFYPVFPPNEHAQQVLDWLTSVRR